MFSFMLLADPFLFTTSGDIFGVSLSSLRESSQRVFKQGTFGCRLNQVTIASLSLGREESVALLTPRAPLYRAVGGAASVHAGGH